MQNQAEQEAVDRRNRQFLWQMRHNWVIVGTKANLGYVIDHGTPEERAQAVRVIHRRFKRMLAVAGIIAVWWLVSPSSPKVDPPPPSITSAGTVTAIQLNNSTFSTSTSLETTDGIYQVAGAVSGQIGDHADLKVETMLGMKVTSVCVESTVKPHCYTLL